MSALPGVALAGSMFDAVFRPERFVSVRREAAFRTRLGLARQVVGLVAFYVWNVFLYALPLTLAGIGFTSTASAPGWFAALVPATVGDPAGLWRLLVGLFQNSAFLTIATAVVLVSYHGAVLVSRGSGGLLESVHTVVYTTGAYLAAMFTGVMFLSTTPGLETAETLVLNVQKAGFYAVIDWLGADVALPGGRPGQLVVGGLTTTGELILALLVVASLYFVYSLYLGARLNHGMNRLQSTAVLVAISAAPVIYIAGSVVYSTVFL